jgi:hypothetical protein
VNKHLRFFLLLLCAILASSVPALPQTVVSGFVRNAETGAPLSEATVQVEDGFQAMVTNAEGRFELSVDRLPVTLKVSRIGYFSQNLLLNSPLPASVQIMLVPAIFDLDPVIVTDHESVEDIVRRMIENKNAWRARLKSLRAEAYSRFTLENDKDIVFMLEGLADAAWNPQNGWKATVKSFRRSSNNFVDDDLTNLRTLDRLAADALITNLYDDNILIGEHWLMGVTHPEALKSYRYEMEGQRLMDNRLIYDIRVTPKSRLFTGFTGRISVMDEDYAMVEAELKPSEAVIFPPPVREFSLTISQQFARFGAGFWLPVGLQMNAGLDVGIIGLMFPKMKGYLVSRLSNYQVIGIPDDKAAPGDTLSTRPILSPPPRQTVFAMNDSLLGDRMVPLTERERKAYATIDTTQTFIKAFEPKGVIAGVLKRQGVFDF